MKRASSHYGCMCWSLPFVSRFMGIIRAYAFMSTKDYTSAVTAFKSLELKVSQVALHPRHCLVCVPSVLFCISVSVLATVYWIHWFNYYANNLATLYKNTVSVHSNECKWHKSLDMSVLQVNAAALFYKKKNSQSAWHKCYPVCLFINLS